MAAGEGWPPLGTVVWAKVTSWPWWPGLVVPYERVLFFAKGVSKPVYREGKVAVQFFSDGKIALLHPEQIVSFEENVEHLNYDGQHAQQIRDAYNAARAWIWEYGVSEKLPYMQDDAEVSASERADAVIEEVLDSDVRDQVRELRAELATLRTKRKQVAEMKEELRKEIADVRAGRRTLAPKYTPMSD